MFHYMYIMQRVIISPLEAVSEYAGDGMLLGQRGGCTTQHIFYYQVLYKYKYVLEVLQVLLQVLLRNFSLQTSGLFSAKKVALHTETEGLIARRS